MFGKFKKITCYILTAVLAAALLSACGSSSDIDGAMTAVTVNGDELTTGSVAFYVRYDQANYYTSYEYLAGYGLYSLDDPVFDAEYSDDLTFGEYLMDNCVADLEEMLVISQHVDDYGYVLSDERKEEITEAAQTFVNANADMAKKNGISQSDVERVLELYTIRAQMEPYMVADTDREVSDEEAAQTTILYTRLTRTNASEDLTDDAYDELALSEITQLLETLLDLDESETDKDSVTDLADEIDENFTTVSYSYGADDESLDDSIKEAVSGLSDGEYYDGIIILDSYYYIVKLVAAFDEEATETEKETIIAEREEERFSELTEEWLGEAEIVIGDGLSQITVTDSELYDLDY